MPKAYSYLRFSTADQIQGDSLRRQTTLARDWCAKNNIPLVENYRDLGVSAFRSKNADKGALKAFLDRVESGVIEAGSYLIVESLDRLSRTDITYALQMFLGLINAGIVVVTMADERVYDRNRINDGNFTDIIISLTILSRANEESRMKSLRVGQAWAAKRAKISEEKMTAICPAWLKLSADRKKFELIPDKAKIVRRIFQMAAQGKGCLHIARIFHRENVPRMGKGSMWLSTGIKNVLNSRAVIGEYQTGRRVNGKRVLNDDAIPNYFPAVVPMDLYATVQRIRRVRSSYRGRGQGNPLAGLVYNVMTGRKLIRIVNNEEKGWAYLVDPASRIESTPRLSWHYGRFLATLLSACKEITNCPPPTKKENQEFEAALKRKDEIESQIPRLVEFIATGFSASVEEKLRGLEIEKADVEKQIATMQIENSAPNLDLARIDWKDTSKLKENARAVIERIDVHLKERWFTVKTFDGREVRYAEQDNSFGIISNESAGPVCLPVSSQSPKAKTSMLVKRAVKARSESLGSRSALPAQRLSSKRRG
jgi:DNA invertase Pin-like site-specific DNA recombinase